MAIAVLACLWTDDGLDVRLDWAAGIEPAFEVTGLTRTLRSGLDFLFSPGGPHGVIAGVLGSGELSVFVPDNQATVTEYLLSTPAVPRSMASTDFDGDGRNDLVVCAEGSPGTVTVYLNR